MTSTEAVLDLLRHDGPLTRAELLARTGMARSTLAEKVELLRRHGFVRDAEVRRGTGGRPATALAFDGSDRLLLLIDLGATHGTFAVADLHMRLHTVHRQRLDTMSGPDAVLPAVVDAARALLTGVIGRAEVRRGTSGTSGAGGTDDGPPSLLGIAVGFPGPVAPDCATLLEQTMMRGWSGVNLASALGAAFGVTVLVDNDANAMAFGEHIASVRAGGPHGESLLVVKVATGIGAGLIVNGVLHRGAGGGAGELGHVRLAGATAQCTCGSRGCLGAVASGRALLGQLRDRGARRLSDVVRYAQAGDPPTLDAIREAGGYVGAVLAGAVTLVDPHAVLLGGEIGRLPAFVDAVRGPLLQRVPTRTIRRLRLDPTVLADDSVITGLAALLVDAILATIR